jgi:hypothetical protein
MAVPQTDQAVMSRLSTLRSQLSSLQRARWLVRTATAVSALLIAALWGLVGVLVLDLAFELPPPQRLVVIAIAIGVTVWAAVKFMWPMLQVSESVEDMALLVERQQKIDSDLIAALQFEAPVAKTWGSAQLEGAVIEYVAHVGSQLNVFEGFSRTQMIRRGTLLVGTLLALLIAAILYPAHASTFFNRLFLGGKHYPTATTIERIVINQQQVLDANVEGSAPQSMKAAQGRPLQFAVLADGHKPDAATLTLIATGGTRTRSQLELALATTEDRLNRLQRAEKMLREAARNDEIDISAPWREQVQKLLTFDASTLAAQFSKDVSRASLADVADEVAGLLKHKDAIAKDKLLYTGELPRLLESVRYSLVVGDAWTDPATIAMIPLPAVEPQLNVLPPLYAKDEPKPDAGQRQVALLQGSALEIELKCTNGKALKSAWVNLRRRDETERIELSKASSDGTKWALVDQQGQSPLKNIREEFRYELQVIDEDGLSLEAPIRGAVRIKPDRPPTAAADVVHKVVLPTAQPVIHYRVADDYGISSVKLIAEVERHADGKVTAAAPEETAQSGENAPAAGATTATQKQEIPVHAAKEPLRGESLPLDANFTLNLSPLQLTKGDRLKITLEVVDYRGENEAGQPTGERYQSDPLVLEISDESGVLAAISEADERSEQRLTDIIKRQLGIGESP